MALKDEDYVTLYKRISAVPSVTSAELLPGKNENTINIYSNWSAQDLVKLEKTCFTRDLVFDCKKSSTVYSGFPFESSPVCQRAFSKSGKKQAIVREKKGKNSTDSYDLEIWGEFYKEITFELTDQEEYGKINTNAFACLAWSSNEKYVFFTAECKQLKSSSYFKVSKKDDEKKQTQGQEYAYKEEWGENFVGSHHSILVILDIQNATTKVVSLDNPERSIGDAVWGPDDKSIVFIGYDEFPRRLGIRSCPIRKSAIYVYDCESFAIDCLAGGEELAVRSPRFIDDFKSLIYLENQIDGAHFKTSKLQKCEWMTRRITTLVDIVDSPKKNEFPGLYVESIPRHCWFNNFIFITSQWRSFVTILAVESTTGQVTKIEPRLPTHPDDKDDIFGSCTVLNVYKNFIIAEFSSLNIEPCLAIGSLQIEKNISIEWKYIDHAPVKHNDIEWNIVKMHENEPENYFEIIVVKPVTAEIGTKHPVIIRAHGGPHCAYSPAFSKNIAAFTKLNYINCLINYRGSSGFGESCINSLPGNAGTLDVSDVQETAKMLKSLPNCDITDIFYIGGSHGGFLGAHLIGQFPDFYKAVVLLNPVIDLTGMVETTDIPDWVWVESGCGYSFNPSNIVTDEHLKSMWLKSPMRYAENVKTPVLLLLGSKDLRVPYYQGLKYYRLLKARNVDVSVYLYEDCHSLSKTPHDADVFMQTALWLKKYSQ